MCSESFGAIPETRSLLSVIALIYTHLHDDYFGGAEAIVPPQDPTSSTYTPDPTFPIYAPDGVMDHAVSENVYAGVAMTRRSMYMYVDELARVRSALDLV